MNTLGTLIFAATVAFAAVSAAVTPSRPAGARAGAAAFQLASR